MTTKTQTSTANGKAAMPAPEATATIQIQKIGTERLLIPVKGTASLIVHAWSRKAKQQMLDATQGKKNPKQPKNPEQDYLDSMYHTQDGRYGVPSLAFKGSIVSAARFFGKSTPMTVLRQSIFVGGVPSNDPKAPQLLIPVNGEPRMREDMVRVGMGGTDLRYRAEFQKWTAVVDLRYVKSLISQDSVLSLLDAAGFGVGICEWRPEKSGDRGTFTIDEDREIQVLP